MLIIDGHLLIQLVDEHTVPEHILNELEMMPLTGRRSRDTLPAET